MTDDLFGENEVLALQMLYEGVNTTNPDEVRRWLAMREFLREEDPPEYDRVYH